MKFPQKLYEWQEAARDYINSDAFKNYLIIQPTGCGKTFEAMIAMDKIIREKSRIIYSSPMKSLTSEQTDTFSKEWKVKEITGDTEEISYTKEYLEQFDVFVFTPEKLFSILKKENTRELFFDDLNVDLVVIDEVHMLGEPGRGPALEKLIMVKKTLFPFVHGVYLSATIKNYEEVAEFLDAEINYVPPEKRPIPLQKFVETIPTIYGGKKKFAFKMNVVNQIMNQYHGDKTLLFWSSRERSVDAVKKLAGIGEQRIYGKKLVEMLMNHRVAYHNASLDAATRKQIESGFRSGNIDIVSSTTTLAVGVNMPARNVIIGDVARYNWLTSSEELLKPSEFHQMLGRAGRPGFDTIGRGIVICDEDYEDEVNMILGDNFEVCSQLWTNVDADILDFIVSFVDSRDGLMAITETGLKAPSEDEITKALDWLIEKKFVGDADGMLAATRFGRMTSLAFILPRTALHIVFTDKNIDPEMSKEPEFVDLFDKLMNVEELLNTIVVRDNQNDDLALEIAAKVYKFSDERIAKAFAFLFFPFLEKKGFLSEDEKKLGTGNETKTLQDTCLHVTHAAAMLCPKNKRVYEMLGDMIEAGFLDTKMIYLYNIKGIGQVRLDRLSKGGVDSLKKFIEKTDAELSVIMGVSVDQVKQMKLEAVDKKNSRDAKDKEPQKPKQKEAEQPKVPEKPMPKKKSTLNEKPKPRSLDGFTR